MIERVNTVYALSLLLLAFSFNLRAEVIQIPLSGVGSVQASTELTITPPLLQLGDVEVGSQKSQKFSISYTGDSESTTADIYSVQIEGEDSYDFTTDYNGFSTVDDGQNVEFGVTFSPASTGMKKAYLRIEHSGGNSPHIIFLTGTAIDILTSELKISSSDINFGNVETDQNKNVNFQLTNGGGNNYPPINVYNVIVGGNAADSFSTNFNNVVTIQPGDSITISAKLQSAVAGDKSAVLSIEHDGGNTTLKVNLAGKVTAPQEEQQNGQDPEFHYTKLKNASPKDPTSLQFGPDGKLYVSERNGQIYQYTVKRNGQNNYTITNTDKIDLIKNIKNHDDDGDVNNSVKGRLVTGLLAVGTANNPVIYVSSADPRMAGGPSGKDANLDTNSVIVSRLTKNGNNWNKKDLVRGLPRSEENHQGNGMQLSNDGKKLYLAMGGHTNMGVPSNNFAKLPEYALSAAIIEIDLQSIGNNTYDLPTLDDEDRSGGSDNNDPFGGNNGKNMAILTNNGPVQIYAPGFRNAYDIVLTASGKMYTADNGPNSNWGGKPSGNCLNQYKDGGTTYGDGLHYINKKGYYGGHPNPTRGNKNNKFNNSNPQSPIEGSANDKECDFKTPGNGDGALHVFNTSTNGLDEYTASNFGGSMKGDLLAASFGKKLYRIQLNNAGNKVSGIDLLANNLGTPLDVTAQGDNQVYPGTIWVADYAQNAIHVYEPKDY